MRRRTALLAATAALVVGGLIALYAAVRPDAPQESAEPAAPRPAPTSARPALSPRPVDVRVDGFLSWALLDRTTGRIAGSANLAETSTTESMIKIWIVADHLNRAAAAGRNPGEDRLRQASTAIRDSDDAATQALYELGGGNAVVERMISTCELTDTRVVDGRWSRTRISARDAVRLGACVADGRAAGPEWTGWVLTEMEEVRGGTAPEEQHRGRGGGRWGIVDGLPDEVLAQGVAIKNGWTAIPDDGSWHVNCLAVGKDWVLAVLMRYPIPRGLQHGADACADVTRRLVTPRSDSR